MQEDIVHRAINAIDKLQSRGRVLQDFCPLSGSLQWSISRVAFEEWGMRLFSSASHIPFGRKKGTQLFVLRSHVNQRPASPFFRGHLPLLVDAAHGNDDLRGANGLKNLNRRHQGGQRQETERKDSAEGTGLTVICVCLPAPFTVPPPQRGGAPRRNCAWR